MMSMDWNLALALLVTAETGSLSAAARTLGLTQPTLSRQIAAFEADLDCTLFERVGRKLVITETGQRLLEHARAMGEAAEAMKLAAAGQTQTIAGRVSISATDAYSAYILPEIVERIREVAPHITLAIISSNSLSDLRRREADIAIRHVQPSTDDLVGKFICESPARFYATPSWIARHGRPESPADLNSSDLIAYDDVEIFAEYMRGVGVRAAADDFRLVSENSVVVWEMAQRGLGVCVMMNEIAARATTVVALFPDLAPINVPVWLVAHREVRSSRRVRLVFDLLADELTKLIGAPTAKSGNLPAMAALSPETDVSG